MGQEMQSNQFLFVFSVSLMILKLPIISSRSCLLSKVKTYHNLTDPLSNGNSCTYLLISVNVIHFLILLYLLLSLDGFVMMMFSKFFRSFSFFFPLFLFVFWLLLSRELIFSDNLLQWACVHLFACLSSCSTPSLHCTCWHWVTFAAQLLRHAVS